MGASKRPREDESARRDKIVKIKKKKMKWNEIIKNWLCFLLQNASRFVVNFCLCESEFEIIFAYCLYIVFFTEKNFEKDFVYFIFNNCWNIFFFNLFFW